jgi:hypothetical protein
VTEYLFHFLQKKSHYQLHISSTVDKASFSEPKTEYPNNQEKRLFMGEDYYDENNKKVKLSLYQTVEAIMSVRRRGSHIF